MFPGVQQRLASDNRKHLGRIDRLWFFQKYRLKMATVTIVDLPIKDCVFFIDDSYVSLPEGIKIMSDMSFIALYETVKLNLCSISTENKKTC